MSTTRITDLPDNITMQKEDTMTSGYQPMNIHPNPYLNPDQPETPQFKLPSRDIPMNTLAFSTDEQMIPNYIPEKKLTVDFVNEYDNMNTLKSHQSTKHKKRLIETLLDEFQLPLIAMMIFFFFQLPIVHTLIAKYLKFLPIFHSDGNMNLYGISFITILYGCAFYVATKAIHTVSEL
jgi:hypothetical protein